MSGIVWLASYPKSGNTWVRVFLTNYLRNSDTPADINELDSGPIASSRVVFDEATGLESSDLTSEEIERLRPAVYRGLVARSTDTIFMKTHDAWTRTPSGQPVVGDPAVTRYVIYLIRNPLDVIISFANHAGASIDKTIDIMGKPDAGFAGRSGHLSRQLRQPLSSWSGHVRSWVEESGLPVCVIRYEDLVGNPLESFTTIIQVAGLTGDAERLERAIRFSGFDLLQAQERKTAFRERPQAAERFFRKGVIGDWRDRLTPAQVDRVIAAHGETMQKYGYRDTRANAAPCPERESVPTSH